MKNIYTIRMIFPVLFGFFIMGFVDVVGIATNYVKKDFALSDTLANLIPMMAFVWFAICSLPTSFLMDRIGRRNTVVLSIGITALAMCVPLLNYEFLILLLAFALLGIGNTMLQVALNPMVAQIVSPGKVASVLTLGQFFKAISSLGGPVIAGLAAAYLGGWKMIFVIFSVISVIAALWMMAAIHADKPVKTKNTDLMKVISLLTDKKIICLFLGILFVVGIDVGLNTSIPGLLMERTNLSLQEAGLGTSLYFASRTAGTFAGAFILSRYTGARFLKVSMVVSISAFIVLLFVQKLWIICVLLFIVGITCANVFSILFSYALQYKPDQANEVSALMIMGVSGGALVMPFMGVLSDVLGQTIGLFPLLGCMIYILWIAWKLK